MRKITNRKIRLVSNLFWLVLTVNYLWVSQSVFFVDKLIRAILFYILTASIVGMTMRFKNVRVNNIDVHKSEGKLETLFKKLIQFYHAIDFQRALNNPSYITLELCEHILEITKVRYTFVWQAPQESDASLVLLKPDNKLLKEKITNELAHMWDDLRCAEEVTLVEIVESWYLVPVKTSKYFYGFIGVFWDETACLEFKESLIQDVMLLAEWSTIIYERAYTETLMAKSIVEVEQKRIGEEIHDYISGRLFSAVCATTVLTRSTTIHGKDKEQLQLIASTINQALSELRFIIYSLKVTSDEQWLLQVIRYLKEAEKLHGISVSLLFKEESISIGGQQARALHRIIYEAANNAIKHGRCKNLTVELTEEGSELRLTITDDGFGFNLQKGIMGDQGLGLNNIKRLANSMNAILSIESHLGQGTRIEVIIPDQNLKITSRKICEEEAS